MLPRGIIRQGVRALEDEDAARGIDVERDVLVGIGDNLVAVAVVGDTLLGERSGEDDGEGGGAAGRPGLKPVGGEETVVAGDVCGVDDMPDVVARVHALVFANLDVLVAEPVVM